MAALPGFQLNSVQSMAVQLYTYQRMWGCPIAFLTSYACTIFFRIDPNDHTILYISKVRTEPLCVVRVLLLMLMAHLFSCL